MNRFWGFPERKRNPGRLILWMNEILHHFVQGSHQKQLGGATWIFATIHRMGHSKSHSLHLFSHQENHSSPPPRSSPPTHLSNLKAFDTNAAELCLTSPDLAPPTHPTPPPHPTPTPPHPRPPSQVLARIHEKRQDLWLACASTCAFTSELPGPPAPASGTIRAKMNLSPATMPLDIESLYSSYL